MSSKQVTFEGETALQILESALMALSSMPMDDEYRVELAKMRAAVQAAKKGK